VIALAIVVVVAVVVVAVVVSGCEEASWLGTEEIESAALKISVRSFFFCASA